MYVWIYRYRYANKMFYDITECLFKNILALYQDRLWVLHKFLRNFSQES